MREKLAFFKAHHDEFDTLFIGSSRVYRQISPEIFDRELTGLGVPVKSFNLGIDAMTSPELFYVFDRAMESKPTRLRHVIVDVNPMHRNVRGGHDPDGRRTIYWHDFERTQLALRGVLQNTKVIPLSRQLEFLKGHTFMMLRNYANVGDGSTLMTSFRPASKKIKSKVLGPAKDGYLPIDLQMPKESISSYEKALEQRLANGRPIRRDPILEDAFANFIEKVSGLGARVYFIISPTVEAPILFEPGALPWRSNGLNGPVALHFDDPADYPELFDWKYRFDMEHLNKEGAIIYTHLLAKRLAAAMSSSADTISLTDAPIESQMAIVDDGG